VDDQPTTPESVAQQAYFFIEKRRFVEARRILGDGLRQFPESADLLFHSAQVDWLEDNLDAAQKTVGQALAADPEHAAARELLASILMERGAFADAERLLLDLLRDYPQSAAFYGRYSRLMLRTLHLDKAERLAREGLRYDPEDHECLMAQALCETARSGGKPNESLQKLLRLHPESMSAVHALVVALVDSGRSREALVIAREALRADPANEHLVELVKELRRQSHWSMLPLYPLQKWGWMASGGLWVAGIVITGMLRESAPDKVGYFIYPLLGYVIYSWVWPPVLRRIL
jgi:tetratricopeptide (TPR) repeat protein